jgi:phosphonate transport system substrate-binding protein
MGTVKLKLLIIVLLVLTLALPGCGTNSRLEQGGASGETKVLHMGLIPAKDSTDMLKSYRLLIAYLEKNTGLKIELSVLEDYSAVIRSMRSGQLDLALYGPFSYIMAAELANAEAFVVEVRESGANYKSIIVAHKDSGISKLEDLRGKRFAFVDPASTSGNLVPRAQLKSLGIIPERDFSNTIFAGGHDAVEVAVRDKKVDAGADHDFNYSMMVSKGQISPHDIKIIWESEPIPGSLFAFRKDLPEDIKKRIKEAFLIVHSESPGSIGGVGKVLMYVETSDSDYDVIRDVTKMLDLDLSKMY